MNKFDAIHNTAENRIIPAFNTPQPQQKRKNKISPELHKARADAHVAFDRIWKGLMAFEGKAFKQAKGIAYSWLSRKLGLPIGMCHMSMMAEPMCQQVIKVCETFRFRSL